MSDEQLVAKYLAQTIPAVGVERARRILERCWRLADVGDVGEALHML
ncbi:hypothetical protein [Hydrogenophaga sp. BPS33]|nr:hypothetical protein [Hydrogenophaga sp. BPS33]